jgi:hypothetical protein
MSQFTSEAGTSKGCYEDTQMIKLHMRTGRPLSGTDFVEHLELLLDASIAHVLICGGAGGGDIPVYPTNNSVSFVPIEAV